MTHETISQAEGAKLFLRVLENNGWRFSLSPRVELVVIVGDDEPPRWPQSKIFASLEAMMPAVIALLAERDGLAGVGDERVIH